MEEQIRGNIRTITETSKHFKDVKHFNINTNKLIEREVVFYDKNGKMFGKERFDEHGLEGLEFFVGDFSL